MINIAVSVTKINNMLRKHINIASKKEIIRMNLRKKDGLTFLNGLLKNYAFEDDGMDNKELKWKRIKHE